MVDSPKTRFNGECVNILAAQEDKSCDPERCNRLASALSAAGYTVTDICPEARYGMLGDFGRAAVNQQLLGQGGEQ